MSNIIRLRPTAVLPVHDCAEHKLVMSRRGTLGLSVSLFSAAFLPSWAEASAASGRLLLVVLRGGTDGLSTIVPHGDPHYLGLRGEIAIPQASTLALNSFFGAHPSLARFSQWYAAGEAAVVHAACVPVHNRSHFDAQDNLESGMPGIASNPTGWLNRLLTALPTGSPVRTAGAIQIGEAPLVLRGPAPVLGWSPTWFQEAGSEMRNAVLANYRAIDRPLEAMLERGLEADDLAEGASSDSCDNGTSPLRAGFLGAARLMRANGGPHIAVLSVGGFDTHSEEGGVTGELATRLAHLDAGLNDFKCAIGSLWSDTVVVCATEFGRTAKVNGDKGTDHGVGSTVLLAGGSVQGGQVYGDWPGLAPAQLYEDSDLAPTTDMRSIFKGILRAHLDVPSALLNSTIFPGSAAAPAMTSLIKTPAAAQSAAADAASDTAGVTGTTDAATRAETPLARYRRRQA